MDEISSTKGFPCHQYVRPAQEPYLCETALSFRVNNEEIGTVVLCMGLPCRRPNILITLIIHGPAAAAATVIMLLPFTIALRDFLSERRADELPRRRRRPFRPRCCSYQLFRGVFANDKNCSRFVRATHSEQLRLLGRSAIVARNVDVGGSVSAAFRWRVLWLRCCLCMPDSET